jgi:hypothetical protein
MHDVQTQFKQIQSRSESARDDDDDWYHVEAAQLDAVGEHGPMDLLDHYVPPRFELSSRQVLDTRSRQRVARNPGCTLQSVDMMDLRQMMAAKKRSLPQPDAAPYPAQKHHAHSSSAESQQGSGDLTAEQQRVVQHVLSGRSVFITGKAGTGALQ